jgi:predicted nucleic acid-binding protein
VTEFEVVNGATKAHLQFWDGMLTRFTILDLDSRAARQAADIVAQLKIKRKTIDKPDLFIAATAVVHELTLDTLNVKHFTHIELKLADKIKRLLTVGFLRVVRVP